MHSVVCDYVKSQRLLQDLEEGIQATTKIQASQWVDEPWFAEALQSPHNAQGTASKICKKHKDALDPTTGASTLSARFYMVAYLRLMRNILAHAKLGQSSEEDIHVQEVCPLGYVSQLVACISTAFSRADAAPQQK